MPFFTLRRAYLRRSTRPGVKPGRRTIVFGRKALETSWMLRLKRVCQRCCIQELCLSIPTAERRGWTSPHQQVQQPPCSHHSRRKAKSNVLPEKEIEESFCAWAVFTAQQQEVRRTCSGWRSMALQRSSDARMHISR